VSDLVLLSVLHDPPLFLAARAIPGLCVCMSPPGFSTSYPVSLLLGCPREAKKPSSSHAEPPQVKGHHSNPSPPLPALPNADNQRPGWEPQPVLTGNVSCTRASSLKSPALAGPPSSSSARRVPRWLSRSRELWRRACGAVVFGFWEGDVQFILGEAGKLLFQSSLPSRVFLRRREAAASCWENDFETETFSHSSGNSTAWEASFQRAESLELSLRSPSLVQPSTVTSLLRLTRNRSGPNLAARSRGVGLRGCVAEISSAAPAPLPRTESLRALVALPRYRAPELGPGTKNN